MLFRVFVVVWFDCMMDVIILISGLVRNLGMIFLTTSTFFKFSPPTQTEWSRPSPRL